MEPTTSHVAVAKKGCERLHKKCSIRVLSRTHRLADPDGRSVKAAVDGLREAGILEDDSAEFITQISQAQEVTKGDEETVIDVIFEEMEVRNG